MPDTTLGFLLVGLAIVFVLGLVFALASRQAAVVPARPTPPPGVHLPSGSFLPATIALAVALIGAGLAFRPQGALANWFILVPGLVVFVVSCWSWVRAAGREWREREAGPRDDLAGH